MPQVEGREISVHLAQFPKPEEIYSEHPAELLNEWKIVFIIRDEVLKGLEDKRQKKEIGKGLEAGVEVMAGTKLYVDLIRFRDSLKELFNVSTVQLTRMDTEPLLTEVCQGIQPLDLRFRIKISSATGQKCARCWNFMPEVANYGIWQNVCTRCSDALTEMHIDPPQPTEAAQ